MSLETLSPSRAADFKTCPLLYRFRSIDRLDEQPTVHQARGTTAHLALQRLFEETPDERTVERLHRLFRDAWTELRALPEYTELFESEAEERAWGIRCLELMSNYFRLEDPSRLTPIEREMDLREDLDGLVIRGILDRIDRRGDGRLVITDYKTGAPPSDRGALPAFFALKVYCVLIRRRLGETPAEIRLLHLRGPAVVSMDVDDRLLDGVERQLRALWQTIQSAIENDRFPARRGPHCNWCSFRHLCPAFSGEGSAGALAAGAAGL